MASFSVRLWMGLSQEPEKYLCNTSADLFNNYSYHLSFFLCSKTIWDERRNQKEETQRGDLSFTQMLPVCFPLVQRKCSDGRKAAMAHVTHLFAKITTLQLHAWWSPQRKKKSLSRYEIHRLLTDFLPLQSWGSAQARFIFGSRGCILALINSGRAALSVELPPEPCCTITQGGHLRSVWVWSCARVMNSCFFSFVAHQHFYSAVNPPGRAHFLLCNFSPFCAIVYLCVCVCIVLSMERLLLQKHLHSPCPVGTGGLFKDLCVCLSVCAHQEDWHLVKSLEWKSYITCQQACVEVLVTGVCQVLKGLSCCCR